MPSSSSVHVAAPGAGQQGVGELGARGQGAGARDGASLTELELAWLAAWDRAGGLAEDEEWLAEGGDWLDDLPPERWDEPVPVAGPAARPAPTPVEALPGMTPRRWGTGGGFDAGGVADTIQPGPVLAGLAADKQDAGLARVSDDELAGLMIAWRRIASWATAGELAAVAELDRRRTAQAAVGADPHLAEHVADEVAMVLTLTARAAGKLTDFALSLARLPKTRAALRAGDIDAPKASVIIDELAGLDGPHAARVEASVIGNAPRQTTGELRRASRRAVIAADPDAARRRKEKAARDARVECWQEQAGTTALAGRDLPPAGALAADQRISAYARWLKNAGAAGTLDGLRAQVYLALLNGQPVESLLPVAGECEDTPSKGTPCDGAPCEDTPSKGTGPGDGLLGGPPPAPGSASAGGVLKPGMRGTVNLILPLATWLGWSQGAGEAAGFGPLDAEDSRALAAALARDSATRWCLTIVGSDGRAVAHGCAKAGPGHPVAPDDHRYRRAGAAHGSAASRPGQPPGETAGQPPMSGPGAGPGPPRLAPGVVSWLAGIGLAWLEAGTCSHRWESAGYRPSPSLAHLIQIRQQRCTAPGCRRPAEACDFEHTIPWHRGGRTCLCNGGPCCRRHHRCKQASGWGLAQPRPGVFIWTAPHGRRYRTEPEPYPH